jgi:hypothetical protein
MHLVTADLYPVMNDPMDRGRATATDQQPTANKKRPNFK